MRSYKARVLCCRWTHSALQRPSSARTSLYSQTFFVSSASWGPRNVAESQPQPPSERMDLGHWLLESHPASLHTSRAQVMHTWHLEGKMNTHLKHRKGKGEASVDSFLVPTWTAGHAVSTPEQSLPNFWSSPLFQEAVESLGKFSRPTSYPSHWHDLRRIEAGSAIVLRTPCCESDSWPLLWTERQPCNKLRKCWHHCKSYSLTITYRFLICSDNFVLSPIPMNLFSLNV